VALLAQALLAAALVGLAPPTAATRTVVRPRVEYRVGLDRPHRQYAHVEVRITDPTGTHDDLAMPAWTPGSYLIRDFAKHVYDLRASDTKGHALAVQRIDKQTWRVQHDGAPYEVRYRVFAPKRSVRTSHIDDHHASLVGTSVLLYVVGELDRPTRLRVDLPRGWSIYGALDRIPSARDRAVFLAPDYDRLVDAPLEAGRPEVRRFSVDGTDFELVVTDAEQSSVDLDRLAGDMRRIVETQGRLMGGFPTRRYVFLLDLAAGGGGGLEHADSASMMMARDSFDTDAGYASAQRLVAHEFFHLWNVKRIHDVVLGPFDYGRENHSTLLWFHEGFTEAVESISLRRAGFISESAWVAGLAADYTGYLAHPGRDHDPLSQLSFEAWTKAYQPADNHPNVAISYYTKGKLVGILLDVELRLRSAKHGTSGTLLGLMRRLMADAADHGRGITAQDIRAAATAEAGEPMGWFFDRYVDGTEALPLPDALRRLGLQVHDHAAWTDATGTLRADGATRRAWAGLLLTADGEVDNVVPDSPADDAGFMRHDQIVAVDGHQTESRSDIERRFGARGPGRSVSITSFRDGRLRTKALRLRDNPNRTFVFALPAPDAPGADVRNEWLGQLPTPERSAEAAARGSRP
jgi:predicted metalloprotease with PDZ domain